MKKASWILLWAVLICLLVACSATPTEVEDDEQAALEYQAAPEEPLDVEPKPEQEPEPPVEPVLGPPTLPGRIAIVTDDGGNWPSEQYLSVVSLIERHGAENIVHLNWPRWRRADRYCDSRLLSFAQSIADDPEIRVLIVNPVRSRADRLIYALREQRSDIFIIYIEHPLRNIDWEDYADSVYLADLILNADMREVHRRTPMQARELGADTLVLFGTYPGDLIYRNDAGADAILEERHIWRTQSEAAGLNFVEVLSRWYEAPQCMSDLARYMEERIGPAIAEHGRDIVFVGLCPERLFWVFLSSGTIYPAPLAEYFGLGPYSIAREFSQRPALEELSREEFFAKENLALVIEETRRGLDGRGLLGRVSTWPVSTRSMFTYAAVEYAIMWMNGEAPEDEIDTQALERIMVDFIAQYADKPEWGVAITPLSHDGVVHSNYLLVFLDFMTY